MTCTLGQHYIGACSWVGFIAERLSRKRTKQLHLPLFVFEQNSDFWWGELRGPDVGHEQVYAIAETPSGGALSGRSLGRGRKNNSTQLCKITNKFVCKCKHGDICIT